MIEKIPHASSYEEAFRRTFLPNPKAYYDLKKRYDQALTSRERTRIGVESARRYGFWVEWHSPKELQRLFGFAD